MKRYQLPFFASASLLLFAAIAALWVRSFWITDSAAVSWVRIDQWQSYMIAFTSDRGSAYFVFEFEHYSPMYWAYKAGIDKSTPIACWVTQSASKTNIVGQTHFGFGKTDGTSMPNLRDPRDHLPASYIAPIWSLEFLLAILPAAWIFSIVRRGRLGFGKIGHCMRCGYDLRASLDNCPECGSPTNVTRLDSVACRRSTQRACLAAAFGATAIPLVALILVPIGVHFWRHNHDAYLAHEHALMAQWELSAGICKNDVDDIQRCIAAGAKVNESGEEYLCLAVRLGYYPAAKCLIENGADVNAPDSKGHTPLSTARENKDQKLEELLLQHGARE